MPTIQPQPAQSCESFNDLKIVEKILGQENRFVVGYFVKSTDYGKLFRGKCKATSKPVDIKLLQLDSRQAVEDRTHELKKIQILDHPQLEKILWFGDSGHLVLVITRPIEMLGAKEWIDGNRGEFYAIAEMVEKIARLTQYLSELRIVHGFIVPDNISFSHDPVLVNCGLYPKTIIDPDNRLDARELRYVAPEFLGDDPQRIDIWTDVYGVGQLFYWAVVGNMPFERVHQERVVKEVSHYRPLNPRYFDRSIPREVEAICMKSLSRRRLRRYKSPKKFAEDVCRFRNDEPIVASIFRRESFIKMAFIFGLGMMALVTCGLGVYACIPDNFDAYGIGMELTQDEFDYEFD